MVIEPTPPKVALDEEQDSDCAEQSQKGRKKRLLWLGGACLLTAGAIIAIPRLTSQSPPPQETSDVNVLPVETVTVQPKSGYQVSRSYTGKMVARRNSKLGLECGGELTEVLVEEGDRVAAGEPIARLDTRNLSVQKQQLQAQHSRALAQLEQLKNGSRQEKIAAARARVRNLQEELELKQKQRSRREFLYQEGAISQEQRDEAVSGEQALQARLDQAESQLQELLNGTRQEEIAAQKATVEELQAKLEEIEIKLSQSVLTAPFDGIVSQRFLDEGTVVKTGQPVIELIGNTAPEARVGVPPSVAQQFQEGASAKLTIDGDSYQGTVTSIPPEISEQTQTRTLVFRLPPDALLETTPGQTVQLNYRTTIDKQGYWLPISALTKGIRGLWTVYVVVPDGEKSKVQQEAVEMIHQQENRALVRGTLEPNAEIVANGTHRLVPGQRVSVKNE
ncbi:MAG: efflux transporter periplasmic adaptor subunit [Cyanobacteria bacterium SW_9_44_58]|nr:MAG: efflux transporter periplasmic adaptor subunit [Cyanobacteria bacterium SW_9_44_58]